ncbi:MAG: Holliday junction resolvase RuvX [Phycisphaerales bacterium]|nr:Holliday junction resolvase RuvX [Phycisphaerales bacterium]
MTTRFFCIDLGDKRTGLAIGDDQTRICSPLTVLEVPISDRQGEALLEALIRAMHDQFSPHAAVEIVFGLPLNMDDASEGPRSKLVRTFADRFLAKLNPPRPVHFQDERLSSVDADWQMSQSGLTHKQKKHRRDALAAAAILRDYLASRLGVQDPDF